jgi:S-DNA-T family DNA segregation ATPase FtsK/SpoIIIE
MARREDKKSSGWRRFFHFLWLKPVRWFLLVIIIGAIIWWQLPALKALFTHVTNNVAEQLGWGLVLIVIALFILLIFLLIRRVPSFVKWVRVVARGLGVISLLLAIWGILAFAGLGGNFGQALISHNGFIGALRVLGFVVFGIILVAPVASYHGFVRFIRWSVSRTQARQQKRHIPRQKQTPAEAVETPRSVTQEKVEKKVVTPIPAPTLQDLKQVAQDVWKKYGESSSLITVDGWKLPPIDILEHSTEIELSPADNDQRAKRIEEALDSYGVEAKVVQINPGPTVTQFGIEPGWDRKTREVKERDRDGSTKIRQEEISRTRVKVDRITSLANDLALTLAAPSLRIEAPVPGKGIVGIEVPNIVSSVVSLRDVVETSVFQKLKAKSKLTLGLGKGAGGEAAAADLARMPHLLIAGATGSGKTVCLNTIVCSLLLHNTPDEVQFIMVDPKRVELTPFNSIPHLAAPVIVDTDKALTALRWLSQEMDRRYKVMAAANVRNIDGYNKNKTGMERMPYLILIIDELADLMMTSSNEVEHNLCRLAQLARATGIHLVVATQRPSVDVITGLIKANFPTRISFAVTSQVDSRTILDSVGAEKLLGKGDMLYAPTEADKPKRLQGCFVSDSEVERLVYFWNSQQRDRKPSLNIEEISLAAVREGEPADPLLEEARKLAREHEHISTSFLQRRLRIGYPRAARIMDQLEEEGVERHEEEGG